jgi:TonB family protein
MRLRLRTAHLVAALALAAVVAGAIGWIDRVPARYFPENEVDRKAYPLRRIDLPYPDDREGVDYYGTLRMELRIDEHGRVDRVDVVKSTLPERYRDACVKAFATARFEPALRKGRKVKSVKRVEVRFAPPLRGLSRDS